MNSEANSEASNISYSVRQLAGMGLPGYPGTERAWLDRVKNEGWVCVEFKGQGRGGIRREYTPPPAVMALIEARQRGEQPIAPIRKAITKRAAPVEITEDDYIDLTPPKISGAAKCPGCGAFVGLIQLEGRVRLEFDSPGAITLMSIMVKLQPVFKGDVEALYDLSLRAYAVLSLLTAGNEESINNLLSKPNLVETLSAFCAELNITPPHSHGSSKTKTDTV